MRLVVVDPRRTLAAEVARDWLPVRVGADIALANAMGQAIIQEGLQHRWFIDDATTGFDAYKQLVASYTPEWAETVCGVPAAHIREICPRLRARREWHDLLDAGDHRIL